MRLAPSFVDWAAGEQRTVEVVLFDWVPAGAMHTFNGHLAFFNAQWGMLLDPLSVRDAFRGHGRRLPDSRLFDRLHGA
jgi:hypothetical protein